MPKGSILVVDDEAEIREGLEALLTSENFAVTLAGTGADGLQQLEDHPFDLMLLDVSLAGPQRDRDAAGNPAARSPAFDNPDYRVRLDRHGARRIQEWGAGLHHQAVVER